MSTANVSEALFQRQLELERTMSSMGVTRFRERLAKAKAEGTESSQPSGQRLLQNMITPVAEGIRQFIETASSGKAGRRHMAVRYLKLVDPDVAALIIGRTILDCITRRVMVTKVALAIASHLEDEVRFGKFEEAAPAYYAKIKQNVTEHDRHRRRVFVHSMNKLGIEWEAWPPAAGLHLGVKCIELFVTLTGYAEIVRLSEGRAKTKTFLMATAATMEWITSRDARCELLTPVYLPTLIPPRPWTNVYSGGYHTSVKALTMVKVHNSNLLEELRNRTDTMPVVFQAINAIQATPWKINVQVLDVMIHCWENNLAVAKLPPRDDRVPSQCPISKDADYESLDDASKERFKQWKVSAREVHEYNHRQRSKRVQIAKIISVAEMFRTEGAIYFPHQLDFRSRAYAVPMFLNPQGCDRAKGALLFANGKPLGNATAAGWLAIHGANVYGFDKVVLEDRITWVEQNEQSIIACAADPYGTTDVWGAADKPWQFLAFCFEWAAFKREGFDFVSHIPVALDGSCNGLQHYSAALRDPRGGAAVNLTPSDKPQDIYQRVADVVCDLLRQYRSAGGTEDGTLASRWLAWGIDRSSTKRSVMVVPYSGTMFACRKYILEHINERIEAEEKAGEVKCPFDKTETFAASSFLAKIVWEAIGREVIAARVGMDWLAKTAKTVVKEGLPVVWHTPVGFPVMQAYRETATRRIETMFGDSILKLNMNEQKDKLDSKRNASAIAPNFVHGLDASHMFMSVCKASDYGVVDFAMIHDSYGTVAADTEVMFQSLRVAFVEMYRDHDVFEKFRQEVNAVLSDGVTLKPCPPKGTLNIESVLDSEFFFA